MTFRNLSAIWETLAPALGNHLWQSTVFALAAALLTLLLRKQQARVRYWLWMAASVKFLVPFSLLVEAGRGLAWTSLAPLPDTSGIYLVVDEISQPFTQVAAPAMATSHSAAAGPSFANLLPLLLAFWIIGFAAVGLVWLGRWRRVSAVRRAAVQLREGREVEALRRIERVTSLPGKIEFLLSQTSLEPGIFGVFHPALLWPEGISPRLDDAHLEAIIAHELWHVRRRDNLAAAFHMIVEALFWFHPLVWWLGARLVEERERACDEQVVAQGGERQVYAESILKVCEFCVGSPLACVAGVTGADLKKRMVYIMTERIARKLGWGKKMLLTAAACAALAAPIVFGIGTATQERAVAQDQAAGSGAALYESAVVRPSAPQTADNRVGVMFGPEGFTARNATLATIIGAAYGVQPDLISGAPDWDKLGKYDMEVKMSGPPADLSGKKPEGIGVARLRAALQQILADRFKLVVHQEAQDRPIFALTVGSDGPKLQQTAGAMSGMRMSPDHFEDHGASMQQLADQLSWRVGRTVVDKTGLTGKYDFSLTWKPAAGDEGVLGGGKVEIKPLSEESISAITTAMQEQLGLTLQPQQVQAQVLVIDHVEQPVAN